MGHYDDYYDAEEDRRRKAMDKAYRKCGICKRHITEREVKLDDKSFHEGLCSLEYRVTRLEKSL